MASKQNYTLRRVVVLVVLLALAAGIYFAVTALRNRASEPPTTPAVSGTPSPSVEPTPTPTPTPEPEPDPVAATPTTCPPEALQVAVTADAGSYTADQAATFQVSITNVGAVTCLTDGGTAAVALTVMSGNDRIWGSADCLAEATTRPLLLEPSVSDDKFVSVWNTERSQEGCPGGLPAPLPGTYTVSAVVGGTSSPNAVFQITG